jgi:hypothetical protein
MNSRLWIALALSAALCAPFSGCGDDDDSGGDADADADADADTDTDTDADADGGADAGSGANGSFCTENAECDSYYCVTFQSVPPDPDGACAAALAADEIRIMANVRDFYTEAAIPDQEIRITGAMAAMMNPTGAAALTTATTDADGRFDVSGGTEITSTSVGIVAIGEADGYFLSITGLVEPELEGGVYPSGIRNHDVKMMSQDKLDEWSGYLASFSDLSSYLPLGQAGAVVARVRYVGSGDGVPGVVMESTQETSNALIYYLNEAEDGFDQTATGSSGIFLLFNPGLAEKFVAMKDGAEVSRSPATMGQTAGSIYTNTVQIEQ